MTSVVGILNKRGVAIAADSAVTRKRYDDSGRKTEKVTKNGNKMVRLSDVDPITVMFTGNAEFLGVSWDIIARRYRQQKGKTSQPTVESAVKDFFEYIASNSVFWDKFECNNFLYYVIRYVFREAADECKIENERNDDGTMKRPGAFKKAMIRQLSKVSIKHKKEEECPQFSDYSIDALRESACEIFDEFISNKQMEKSNGFRNRCYPKEVLDAVRPCLEQTVLDVLSHRLDVGPSATLVFTGYGSTQEYPSLVSVVVCEGFDSRMNYSIAPMDVICISDRKPVAICPFAQKDVIKSILHGIHEEWLEHALDGLRDMTNIPITDIFEPKEGEERPDFEFTRMLFEVEDQDLLDSFKKAGMKMRDRNQHDWEKALEKYDLEEMAALADSLINLTGFHRILTFSHEGVGGLVDLGVISKNEGFSWIRRKSWYHKDNVGNASGFGI